MLWTFHDFVQAMGATPFLPGGAPPKGVGGLSIDTRTLEPGDAYFAIKGDVHDGHDFVDAAREGGAACAVVARAQARAAGGLPIVIVEDVVEALGELGRAARARTDAMVIAVTGSVGKTTTKEMLRGVLAPSGRVHAAVASFNNHWGVPLTLARMPQDTDFAVIEIGMNHPGEITPLVAMARPHVALVTTVAPAHLGAFASVEEIAYAKAEIFSGLQANGVALVPRDSAYEPILAGEAGKRTQRVVSFGRDPEADMRLLDYTPGAERVRIGIAGRTLEAVLGSPGEHMALNATAALGVAFLAGADLDRAAAALAAFAAGKGRGERHVLAHPEGPILLIDESYNANNASMEAALAMLDGPPARRRVAVLGDMLELGEHSRRQHLALKPVLERHRVDLALLVGPEMEPLADALKEARAPSATGADDPHAVEARWFAETPQLATIIADVVEAQDVVVVKSSLGLGFARIVDALRDAYPPAKEPEGTG